MLLPQPLRNLLMFCKLLFPLTHLGDLNCLPRERTAFPCSLLRAACKRPCCVAALSLACRLPDIRLSLVFGNHKSPEQLSSHVCTCISAKSPLDTFLEAQQLCSTDVYVFNFERLPDCFPKRVCEFKLSLSNCLIFTDLMGLKKWILTVAFIYGGKEFQKGILM